MTVETPENYEKLVEDIKKLYAVIERKS